MFRLKIRKVGDDLVAAWPEEALAHLKAKEGDELLLMETPTGFSIWRSDSDFAETMEIAEEIMDRYADAYRELAKK